jgi:nitrate reductase gamma subunit
MNMPEHEISPFLHFAEHRLQEVALVFMAVVYTLRIRWLVGFKPGGDRQPPTGLSNATKGALHSLANIAMPWAMESYRRNPLLYAQFVVFHLAVAVAILQSFLIPYAPGVMANAAVVRLFQVMLGAAVAIGIYRIVRRLADPYMRALSSPDDYFSLTLLTVWFIFAVLAAPNSTTAGEGALVTYFLMTAFFLIYVPFSKISHYLYYPFTRYYLGRTLGYRGVFPLRRGTRPSAARPASLPHTPLPRRP